MLKPVHFYRKHVSCNRKENSKGKTQKGNHTEHNKCHLAMKNSTEPLLISRKCEETHDIRITLCPITNGAEHPTESCYPIEIHYDATSTNYATLKDCARPTDYARSPDYVRQKVSLNKNTNNQNKYRKIKILKSLRSPYTSTLNDL